GPIIGFFGLIESWIDLGLIARIARQRPDWLVVVIGRQAVDVSELVGYANIVMLGHKPFAELPAYGRFFDVRMLPYHRTAQVIHRNPIKLREYLAMGKPVVSVRFPHVEQFRDVVYLASDHDDYIRQIERALRENTSDAARMRMETVREHTWEARAVN